MADDDKNLAVTPLSDEGITAGEDTSVPPTGLTPDVGVEGRTTRDEDAVLALANDKRFAGNSIAIAETLDMDVTVVRETLKRFGKQA